MSQASPTPSYKDRFNFKKRLEEEKIKRKIKKKENELKRKIEEEQERIRLLEEEEERKNRPESMINLQDSLNQNDFQKIFRGDKELDPNDSTMDFIKGMIESDDEKENKDEIVEIYNLVNDQINQYGGSENYRTPVQHKANNSPDFEVTRDDQSSIEKYRGKI